MTPAKNIVNIIQHNNAPSPKKLIKRLFNIQKEEDNIFLESFSKILTYSQSTYFTIQQLAEFIKHLSFNYYASPFGQIRPFDILVKTTPLVQTFLEQQIPIISTKIEPSTINHYDDLYFYLAQIFQSYTPPSLSKEAINQLETLFLSFEFKKEHRRLLMSASFFFATLINSQENLELKEEVLIKMGQIIKLFSSEDIKFPHLPKLCVTTNVLANYNYLFDAETIQSLIIMLRAVIKRNIDPSQLTETLLCLSSVHDKFILDEQLQLDIYSQPHNFCNSDQNDIAYTAKLIKALTILIAKKEFQNELKEKILFDLKNRINTIFNKNDPKENNFTVNLLNLLINLHELLVYLRQSGNLESFDINPFYNAFVDCLQYKKSHAAFDCWIQLARLIQDDLVLRQNIISTIIKSLHITIAHKRMSLEHAPKLLFFIQVLLKKKFIKELRDEFYNFVLEKTLQFIQCRHSKEKEDVISMCLSILGRQMSTEERKEFAEKALSNIEALSQKTNPIIINDKYFYTLRLLVQNNFITNLSAEKMKFIEQQIFSTLEQPPSYEIEETIAHLLVVLSTHQPIDDERARFADSLMWDIKEHHHGANIARLISQKLCQIYQIFCQPVFLLYFSPDAFSAPNQFPSNVNNVNNNNVVTAFNTPIPSSYLTQNMYKRKNTDTTDDGCENELKYRKLSPYKY